MKANFHSKAIAFAAVVAALAVPAVASANGRPDVFERYAASHPYGVSSQQGVRLITDTLGGNGVAATPDAFERYAASHPYGASSQEGVRLITDTLGGNGRPVAAPGYRFITDTLGNPQPVATPAYRFITDTLGGNGGPGAVVVETRPGGFDWTDAAIGAGIAVGAIALLTALLALVRLQRHRPQMA